MDVVVEHVMTDNRSASLSRPFSQHCTTRHPPPTHAPYTPHHGKAERFIQTLLREWDYRFTYASSAERKYWLSPYVHFYNDRRAHTSFVIIHQSVA